MGEQNGQLPAQEQQCIGPSAPSPFQIGTKVTAESEGFSLQTEV